MITVKLNRYNLDLSKEKDREKYKKIKEIYKSKGYKLFDYISTSINENLPKDGIYEIDTDVIFSNQYNTVETDKHIGYRIFDWSEQIYDNRKLKKGYYLSEEKDLQELKNNRYRCNYCGKQYTKKEAEEIKWCTECRGSEYLKKDNYNLLELTNINEEYKNNTPPKEIINDIIKQQEIMTKKKLELKINTKLEKLKKEIQFAKDEHRALVWLLEHKIDIHIILENVIFYSHKEEFCFGWRESLDINTAEELEQKLKYFSYKYKIEKDK